MMAISITIIFLAFAWLLYETYLLGVRLPHGKITGKGLQNLMELIPTIFASMFIIKLTISIGGKTQRNIMKDWWRNWWQRVKLNWGIV